MKTEDGGTRLRNGFPRNIPGEAGQQEQWMQYRLLHDWIVIGSKLVLTHTKFGRPIVMRFDDRRIRHAVNRSNNDEDAKQVCQQRLENCFEHPALIVAQRA